MKGTEKNIKAFWNAQALEFKSSPLATAPDTYYREHEIRCIESFLPPRTKAVVLDVGCGNGYSTIAFAKKFPHLTIVGIDYSAEMIGFAQATLKKERGLSSRVSFAVGNVLSLPDTPALKGKKFDVLISERCVINLRSWKEQAQALLSMNAVLKKKGKIIFCENTQEGMARLNRLRGLLDLPAISVRWHNYYVPEKKFLAFAKKQFRLLTRVNIGSAYYLVSRVVYAKLCALEGKEPQYLHPLNKIAAQLPLFGDYSPNMIFILEKK